MITALLTLLLCQQPDLWPDEFHTFYSLTDSTFEGPKMDRDLDGHAVSFGLTWALSARAQPAGLDPELRAALLERARAPVVEVHRCPEPEPVEPPPEPPPAQPAAPSRSVDPVTAALIGLGGGLLGGPAGMKAAPIIASLAGRVLSTFRRRKR